MKIKTGYFKKHIPIQQNIMKNMDHAAEVTLARLR
jgi:hypothetical protein